MKQDLRNAADRLDGVLFAFPVVFAFLRPVFRM